MMIAGGLPTMVQAAQIHVFNLPAGPLADTLIRLGTQAGLSIGTGAAGIGHIRTPALRGHFSSEEALDRLLAGSGLAARFIDNRTVIITRTAPSPPAPHPATPAPPPPVAESPPIIVIGSKRGIALADYPASTAILDLSPQAGPPANRHGSDAIIDSLPMLASTNLGPGRNKLFIRGVADSSFNGPSQSTVSQYLGDVRLTYNAPDPDLNLFDMKRVEVIEGPQGTLYGAGSLGGIVRIAATDPQMNTVSAQLSGGWINTRHGADGSDIAGMVNLPIVTDTIALRAVAYRTLDAGYIDDAERGRANVNRATAHGGRLTARITPGDGWTIDIGGVAQFIKSQDGQYAEQGLPPLTRRSTIAQPFDNDYGLGWLALRKEWGGMTLVSSSGWVHHSLQTTFDATGFDDTANPAAFREDTTIALLTHETRLSGRLPHGGHWVAGISLVQNIARVRRNLGPVDRPNPITGVRNTVFDAAAFGEVDFGLFTTVTATLGARVAYAHLAGETLDNPIAESDEPRRNEGRVLPTVAVAWKPREKLLIFARYQEGFRAGGLTIDGSTRPPTAQRFESDTIATVETGLRYGDASRDPFAFGLTLSYARWRDIQADLIDTGGLPFTDNIGSGRIFGVESYASWRPIAGLTIDASLFLNDSELTHPDPAFAGAGSAELPNIAETGARGALRYTAPLTATVQLSLSASTRYVGKSQLGIGTLLDIPQGDYVETNVGARADFGRYGLSLDISNVGDIRANRFALGNPFSLKERMQTTPLRPRSIRIGFDATF